MALFLLSRCNVMFVQHMLTNQANFPINHPAWISRMEDKGVTSEEGRKEVAL